MKILILHFRSGPGVRNNGDGVVNAGESAGTDGVSLEMAKRARLLGEMGHEVAISSAYDWSDLPIHELEFESQEVVSLMHALFDPKQRGTDTPEELGKRADDAAAAIREELRTKIGSFAPDLIFVHNVFSLPIHPAATKALGDYLRETGIPCAAIHHDVRSEGAYKFTPTCRYARRLLVDYYPPEMPTLRHWAINTLDRDYFRDRGFPAGVIHDTLDFEDRLETSEKERLRGELRRLWGLREDDLVFLLSTRIVPNKQAEIAGALCRELAAMKRRFVGRTLFTGARLTPETRVVLLLAGRPERAFHGYRDALFQSLRDSGIHWKYVGDSVMPRRDESSSHYALYPDTYAAADFALYPTRWEGFGNQFLEIVASGLPVAVYEYPIFKRDLAPLGFSYVSLGSRATKPTSEEPLVRLPRERLLAAARRIWEVLVDAAAYREIVDRNLVLGASHFGLQVLRRHLEDAVQWASK